MVPPEPYINRTRSSFPYGKNDQLIDNQPRRTRRPCPCRQLLPSVAGSGGGMPHGMRSRLDGVWTRARNLFHFPPPFQPSNTGCPSGAGKRYRPSAHHTFAYPGVVPAFSASSCCPALRLTLAPRAVCPLCLDTRPCEPRSRLRWGLFRSHTPIARGLPAAQAGCPTGWRWYLAPWGRVPGLPRRP